MFAGSFAGIGLSAARAARAWSRAAVEVRSQFAECLVGFGVARGGGGGVRADLALELSHGRFVALQLRERFGALGVAHERGVGRDVHVVVAEPVQAVMVFEVLEGVLDAPAAAQHVREARRGGAAGRWSGSAARRGRAHRA